MRELERTVVLPHMQACSFTWLPAREEAVHRNVIDWEKRSISLMSNRFTEAAWRFPVEALPAFLEPLARAVPSHEGGW